MRVVRASNFAEPAVWVNLPFQPKTVIAAGAALGIVTPPGAKWNVAVVGVDVNACRASAPGPEPAAAGWGSSFSSSSTTLIAPIVMTLDETDTPVSNRTAPPLILRPIYPPTGAAESRTSAAIQMLP